MALAAIVWPKLAKYARDYPDVVLDISTEGDSRPDLVAERFDAGIHLGEFVERDMVAVKVSGQQRAAIVAAPGYFDSHPKPKTPRELTASSCGSSRTGVRPSTATSSTTRAGVISRPRSRRWSTRFESDRRPRPPLARTLPPG
jgi:DNA-binding transcriptional LysR family regulator